MENLDSRLLRNQEEERDAAAELSREKRGGASEDENVGEEQSYRQRIQAARQALNLKEQAKKKIEEKVAAPGKLATSNILRWAWSILIPSFGLSLIYINIHVFLRMVVGEKLFCKLGEEWIPKRISAIGGEAGKMAGKSIGIVEAMGLVFLDLIVFFIILGVLGLLTMIMGWIKNPLEAIANLGWGAISALVTLFKNIL